MTKEELKQEAEVCMHNALYWLKLPISKENVEQGGSYILKLLEPREKQIAELSKHIVELQKDKGELIDRCRELEAQVEKMKCCRICVSYDDLAISDWSPCKTCKNKSNWEFAE